MKFEIKRDCTQDTKYYVTVLYLQKVTSTQNLETDSSDKSRLLLKTNFEEEININLLFKRFQKIEFVIFI